MSGDASDCIAGVSSSSAKVKVLGADVAFVMILEMYRGDCDVADFAS